MVFGPVKTDKKAMAVKPRLIQWMHLIRGKVLKSSVSNGKRLESVTADRVVDLGPAVRLEGCSRLG